MTGLRIWISASLIWLLVFYNVERFHEPLNIASFVYVYSAIVAVLLIAVKSASTSPIGWMIAGGVATMIAVKCWLGYQVVGAALPLSITEACALSLTLWLAHRIGKAIHSFEEGATQLVVMHSASTALPFDAGQAAMYREIRRARRFERPLTLVAISADGVPDVTEVHPWIEEIQRASVRTYIDAKLAEVLCGQIKDCDLVSKQNGHFLLLLPESDRSSADQLVQHIRGVVAKQLGVKLNAGSASFPDQEITLTGLLDRAIRELHSIQNKDQAGELAVVKTIAFQAPSIPPAGLSVLTDSPTGGLDSTTTKDN